MPKQTHEQHYTEAVGRRKSAVARVRLHENPHYSFSINEKTLEEYFPTEQLRSLIRDAFSESGVTQTYHVSARIYGGGVSAQAEALRHGIARVLTEIDPDVRRKLKKLGFLKRDPRSKERKKFGLKKARKAPQWSKR